MWVEYVEYVGYVGWVGWTLLRWDIAVVVCTAWVGNWEDAYGMDDVVSIQSPSFHPTTQYDKTQTTNETKQIRDEATGYSIIPLSSTSPQLVYTYTPTAQIRNTAPKLCLGQRMSGGSSSSNRQWGSYANDSDAGMASSGAIAMDLSANEG